MTEMSIAEPERQALVLMAALHDLGKINAAFRDMLTENKTQDCGTHWEVTEVLLTHHDDLLKPLGLDQKRRKWLYAAVAGHHGRPPKKSGDQLCRMQAAAGPQAVADSAEIIRAFFDLWPGAALDDRPRERVRALSWWLPGFITAADWIGSDADWFPGVPPGPDLPVYLSRARARATKAVRCAGLDPVRPAKGSIIGRAPRPMQQAVADLGLPDGPVLALIEDGTGSGKTDAALILAQRMMQAGKGRGMYFALPTMATSDAMFARLHPEMERLFKQRPSLTLSHRRAVLSKEYRDIAQATERSEHEAGPTEWLADSRRRALLASVGVGTIDQALLAVLKARHGPLRLFGLSSKILIVDEVHEVGEPYMAELLATLLQAHRQNGGSAILLTATLPLEQRDKLLGAWGAGPPQKVPYPALTIAGKEPVPVAAMQDQRGPVQVERLSDGEDALDLLVEEARRGSACVWVRNAVDDAIKASDALRNRGITGDLLHARFTLTDRMAHQEAALARFGKDGLGRAGHILVATQIVEASLDLDFDVMVTDLAPVASLIQRAGRLWRHMDIRPAHSRTVHGPVLHVLSPDPDRVTDACWLHQVLDKGAWVYPVDQQWRTASALFAAGAIKTPDGLRHLIDQVYGEVEPSVPTVLEAAERERMGGAMAAQNQALLNRIDLDGDYRSGGAYAEDRDYPTRLGIEQQVLVLARWEDNGLLPWAFDVDRTEAELWMLSEVSASKARLSNTILPDQDTPALLAAKADWPNWRKTAVTLCPVEPDGTICEGLRYDRKYGLLFSSPERRG